MNRYTNPFRIAVESYDARQAEMTQAERDLWFESFWDEWDDSTHDGNSIFDLGNDQLTETEEVVDYDNRMEWIRNQIADDDGSEPGPLFKPTDVVWERAVLLIVAEIVDRTWAKYPETKEAIVSTRELRDSVSRLHLNRPWESITIDFELGSIDDTHFEQIVRAMFSVNEGKVM